MVSSLIGFWVTVRAYASGDDDRVQNVAILVAAAALVLLVLALWVRPARPFAVGVASGLALGLGTAVLLAAGFGAF